MKYEKCRIIENKQIGKDIYNLIIKSKKIANGSTPGQFIEIFPDNHKNILPRPISICDIDKRSNYVRLVYAVVGEGTKRFTEFNQGDQIRILGPLGNGYSIKNKEKIAIIGGGLGVPPMFFLTKCIIEQTAGSEIDIYLGYKTDAFMADEFKLIRSGYNDVNAYVSTEDGSEGYKGDVLSLLNDTSAVYDNQYDIIYACGPKAMLKAISGYAESMGILCFVSTEQRMCCGIGVCFSCTIKNKSGEFKKVCKDGPVFNSSEVIWDD